jgi:hypothetical protein
LIWPSKPITYYYESGTAGMGYATMAYDYPKFAATLPTTSSQDRVLSIYATIG